MDNAKLSKVCESRDELLEQLAGFFLLELVLAGDKTEQLAIATVLHDKEEFVRRLNSLVQLDDVRMADHFQNVDLARDTLHVVNISDLAFVEDLNGYFLVGQHVYTFLNFTEGTLTERFCYTVRTYLKTFLFHF